MAYLLFVLLLVGVYFYWTWMRTSAVRSKSGAGSDLRRRGGLVGTPLQRVQDTRLAATILMLQLVRTGAPVTATEKTKIMELMEDPLGIANVEAIFVRAWSLTDADRVFSPVADELVPLLRAKLSASEKRELIAMLGDVADAWGSASDLQRAAIDRLERRLDMAEPSPVERRFGA